MINPKKIILLGGMIAVLSFMIWHGLKHPIEFLNFKTPKNVKYISVLGKYMSGGLIFLGLSLQEKDKVLKYLGFFPVALASFVLFISYGGNFILELMDKSLELNFFDNWFKTTIVIRILNLGVLICFILFLIRHRK